MRLQFAIDNNLAPVISISYGNCEANLTGFVNILQQEAQQANSQGPDDHRRIRRFRRRGLRKRDCHHGNARTGSGRARQRSRGHLHRRHRIHRRRGRRSDRDRPQHDCGRYHFWGGTTSTTDNLSSALSYIPETTWNDTTQSIAAGGSLSATGGGKSTVFSKPSWQVGAGVPNDNVRDVPDVSLGASPNHDPFLICSQSFFAGVTPAVNSCTTGFRASDGMSLAAVGGTSVGAPAFAGIVALLNQKTGSNGLGNINPTLYSLAASAQGASIFHDIVTGDNKVPCTQGSTGCPTAAPFQIGFSAGPGYDLVTGLGYCGCHQPD